MIASPRPAWLARKRTRDLLMVGCFLLPALSIFFLYRILPLGWNVWLSFHAWSPLKPAQFIGLENYEEMLLDDEVFWQALSNTLIFIGASPLAIAAALGIALLVNSDLRGAAVYRTIVFLSYPLMTARIGSRIVRFASTVAFGGVPGFYTFANGPADPGYDLKLNVVDAARSTTWGAVKRLYR